MNKRIASIHRVAGMMAFFMIFSFFASTLTVELFGDHHTILAVKTSILYAMGLLVLMMAVTGITGAKLAPNARGGVIGKKKKRMPFIAMNGLLILVPSAIYLQSLASQGQFGALFYSVQALELLAGGTNLILMGLNIKDGIKMKKR
ncbi:hypothetical protein [Vibrio tapetis]|uniref:Uncharacterized protein n=1 Tax=Vibrio tapetis subsp. tapetis TaxID=1671868 RepID=A0A2N8ZIU9_9VIBR|nr:hypothetical protein [Vibrio tapetis]SON51827.1 conserved membrane protein of unknown function [Vibrio tapetis subsp. tapetis]